MSALLMNGFFPLQKVTELLYPGSLLPDNALINGGIDSHIKSARTSFVILKVGIQDQQARDFSGLEVRTRFVEL